jgi:hypothetical protein
VAGAVAGGGLRLRDGHIQQALVVAGRTQPGGVRDLIGDNGLV